MSCAPVFSGAWGPIPIEFPREPRPTSLFHVTTPKKARLYRQGGAIHAPVRGFTTMEGAMAWGMKTGRTVIYEIRFDDVDLHKLPEHHNHLGSAWWADADVPVMAPRRSWRV